MTTQAAVIDAFMDGEESPRRASNLKVVSVEDSARDYLIGGQGGYEVLLAYREPIRRVVYYSSRLYSRALQMHPSDVRRQQRKVIHLASNEAMEIERCDDQPRLTASVPELREIMPNSLVERQDRRIEGVSRLP